MKQTDKIEPALTAKEWRDLEEVPVAGDPIVLRIVTTAQDTMGEPKPKRLHYVAALALHSQPFGFTWEDVKRLRALANDAEARHDESIELTDFEEMEYWNHFADRISALLPPP